jgi:hypothetical protein
LSRPARFINKFTQCGLQSFKNLLIGVGQFFGIYGNHTIQLLSLGKTKSQQKE